MKTAIVSDTHGNILDLSALFNKLTIEDDINMLLHLGDNFEDMNSIFSKDVIINKVPGLYSSYYSDPNIPNKIIEKINGHKILLTHSAESHENDLPGDITPADLAFREQINIVFYGHTHIPKIEKRENTWWINPGHLKRNDKRGFPPSYAIADFKDNLVIVTIVEHGNGKILKESILV